MSPPPTEQQVSAALESLRSDATIWEHAAEALGGLRSFIADLHLTPADVSVWAADAGLDQKCNEVCVKLEEVLTQAGENFFHLAGALRDSADTYQREDEEGLHRFRGIY